MKKRINFEDNIFLGCLFLLVLLSELSKIYFISQSKFILSILSYIEIPLYLELFFCIFQKRYKSNQLLIFAFISLILLIGYLKSGMAGFFRGFLLLIASKNIDYIKIIKSIRISMILSLLISLILYGLGISNAGVQRRGYVAFGFEHPNVFAQVVMLILLLWYAEKGKTMKTKQYILFLAVGMIIYFLSGSRTALIVLAALPICILFLKPIILENKIYTFRKILIILSQAIMCTFTYLSAILIEHSSIIIALDGLLVNRIFLNYYALKNWDVKLFGQNTDLRTMGTVYNNIRNIYWSTGSTVDSSYMTSILVMGIIPTIIAGIGFLLVMKRAINEKNIIIISLSIVCSIYGFMETSMIEIYNSFFYFYLMSKSSDLLPKKRNSNL